MANDFDFSSVGKRMPYTVPEGFFEQMERDVKQRIVAEPAKPAKRQRGIIAHWLSAAAATAAAVVLAVAVTGKPHTDFADVEQAFANLDTADQEYVLALYQDDLLMSQQLN